MAANQENRLQEIGIDAQVSIYSEHSREYKMQRVKILAEDFNFLKIRVGNEIKCIPIQKIGEIIL